MIELSDWSKSFIKTRSKFSHQPEVSEGVQGEQVKYGTAILTVLALSLISSKRMNNKGIKKNTKPKNI